MVNGFENETHELTQFEVGISKRIAHKINANSIGKKNAVKARQIINYFAKENISLNDARIRKMIHFIRIQQLCKNLIATSRGYYITYDKKEIDEYIKSLEQRMNSIKEIKNSFTT